MDRRDKKGSRVEHSSAKLQHRSIVEVDTEAEVDSNINGTTAVKSQLAKMVWA